LISQVTFWSGKSFNYLLISNNLNSWSAILCKALDKKTLSGSVILPLCNKYILILHIMFSYSNLNIIYCINIIYKINNILINNLTIWLFDYSIQFWKCYNFNFQFVWYLVILAVLIIIMVQMFSNNDRFYGLNMIELAVFLMQLHDHHATSATMHGDRLRNNINKKRLLLYFKLSNSFHKILNKVSDLRCKRLSSNNGTGPEEDQAIWEKAKLRQHYVYNAEGVTWHSKNVFIFLEHILIPCTGKKRLMLLMPVEHLISSMK
jgi:hypothetical protein